MIYGLLVLVAVGVATTWAMPQRPCVCPFIYKPVCGDDGRTYSNQCALDCHAQVRLVGEGPCPSAESLVLEEQPQCVCTREGRPVCGSDGKTYANPCLLNCATATNPKLSLKSDGACADEVKVVDQPRSCTCPKNMMPVCGSDGSTYDNPCLLNCATATNPSLSVKSPGACDEVKVADLPKPNIDSCACTRNLRPICGSDGKTYNNPCLLNCATKDDPSLSVAKNGPCGLDNEDIPKPEGACTCSREFAPVCGSDGETYSSACIMRCRNPSATVVRDGPCDEDSMNHVNVQD